MFVLQPLPYGYDALEPYLDARTMEIHYTKHHQGYVDNLNKTVEKYPELQKKTVEDLLKHINTIPTEIRTAVRNFGGGVWNHTFYFNSMKPRAGGVPTGTVAEAIKKEFGSFEEFKKQFSDAAKKLFGSGWAWLVRDGKKLKIITTQNQDCPLSDGLVPLLVLDVWEHAYYLKYQYQRVSFIDEWWHVVDWNKVQERFAQK